MFFSLYIISKIRFLLKLLVRTAQIISPLEYNGYLKLIYWCILDFEVLYLFIFFCNDKTRILASQSLIYWIVKLLENWTLVTL